MTCSQFPWSREDVWNAELRDKVFHATLGTWSTFSNSHVIELTRPRPPAIFNKAQECSTCDEGIGFNAICKSILHAAEHCPGKLASAHACSLLTYSSSPSLHGGAEEDDPRDEPHFVRPVAGQLPDAPFKAASSSSDASAARGADDSAARRAVASIHAGFAVRLAARCSLARLRRLPSLAA